jgi:fibro-slime domain-containing protein
MTRIAKMAAVAAAAFLFANVVKAQSVYPTTVLFPVTYYDFHSDGSNPDFNPGPSSAAVFPGMVQPVLDANGLPAGAASFQFSWGIGKWFRPWKQSLLGQGSDFDRPAYANGGATLLAVNTVSYDTSYKNYVILDTLRFSYVPGSPGLYEYADTGFFPLDNRGFGSEGGKHNLAFTAAMHRTVKYVAGMVYDFQCRDDMWVFLNRKLVVDLGGLDSLRTAQLKFDLVPGLQVDSACSLDVFWTQRSGGSSNIKVSTNIIAACPAMAILSFPHPHDTTISSGDSVVLGVSLTYESCGPPRNLDSLIQWKLVLPGRGSLRTATGPTNTYYSNGAVGVTNIIIASFQDPTSGQLFLDSEIVFVKPPPMTYHLYIEPDTNVMLSHPNNPDTVSLVSISQDDTAARTVAAVLRDKFGNFVRFSSNAVWQIVGDTGIIAISTPNKPCVCSIRGLKPGTTYLRLSDDSGSVSDTVRVDNSHFATAVRSVAGARMVTTRAICEYYNLRGQKLPSNLYGLTHVNGLVLERVVEPSGNVHITKRLGTFE